MAAASCLLLPLVVVLGWVLLVQVPRASGFIAVSGNTTESELVDFYDDYAEVFGKRTVTKTTKPNARLKELQSPSKLKTVKLHNLPLALKIRKKRDRLHWLGQDGYVTLYSGQLKVPLLTSQHLQMGLLKNKKSLNRKTNEKFRQDVRVPNSQSATLNGYSGSGYDRGHSAAAANSLSDEAQINTFMLTNIFPQLPKVNRGVWKSFETYTRKKTIAKKDLFVNTILTFPKTRIKRLPDGTAIPDGFYMLLVWCEQGNIQAEYIFVSNKQNIANPIVRWESTESGLTLTRSRKKYTYKAKTATVSNIQKKVASATGIELTLHNNLCNGDTLIAKTLSKLAKGVKASVLEVDTLADTSSSGLCNTVRKQLLSLDKKGKVTLSSSPPPRTVLDLKEGSFGDGCRKSEMLDMDVDDNEGMDTIDTDESYEDELLALGNDFLTASVRTGRSLKLFDLINVPKSIDLSAINVPLQNITYSRRANRLDIHSAPLNKISIIPGVFTVRNVVASLRIPCNKGAYKNIIAAFSGHWIIGNIFLHTQARYDTEHMSLLLRGNTKPGKTIDLKNELNSLARTNLPIPLPSVQLGNIAVTGHIELIKGGMATVVVSGTIGSIRVHGILQKQISSSGIFSGAFAADFGPLRLSNLIRKVTSVDISRVPFLGTLSIPRLGVTISSGYITSSMLPNVFCKEGLLSKTSVTIPKGLQAFVNLKLGSHKTTLKMTYFQSSLKFKLTDGGKLPIGSLLSAIPKLNIRSLRLPPGIRNIFQLQIEFFSFDTDSKELMIDAQFPGKFSFFRNFLTITDPEVKIHAILKHPRKVFLDFSGEIKIGKEDYEVTISRDRSTNNYILRASFKTIPISDFIHSFSAKLIPKSLHRALKKFIRFRIDNAKLVVPLGTKNPQIHLSGTPVIRGFKTIHMNSIVFRQNEKSYLVQGFQLGKVSLASIIRQITRKDLRRIAFLNQHLNTALVISPVTLPPSLRLYGSQLSDIPITKGVSIRALLHWPSNCAQDNFCSVAQRKLGSDAKFTLQGTFVNLNSFTLSAGVSDLRLGSGVVLQRAALQIKVGVENAVGIEGAIYLKKIRVTLSASLRTGTRGVVLQGNLEGCWKRAFGAKWLSICNLHLLIAIQPTVTLVGALELGGEVRIGNPACLAKPITALGYVGIDQLSPRDSFYYVELRNSLTVGTVLQAFCIKFRLPRPLADSGFPNGFLTSFSIAGKEIPKARISIPAGYRLKGSINILGLVVHADVTINIPKGVNMKIALGPLRLVGGRLLMYASSKDRNHGPFLKVFVTAHPKPKVDIHASGFVSVFGISIEARLRITNKQYEYFIRGKFLRLFQASLHITANYGSIKTAHFRVRGHLKNDLFATIRRKIQQGLQKSARAATKAIDNAKRKINSKKAVFNRAIRKVSKAQARVTRAGGAFDRAANKLRRWQRKKFCRLKRCRSVCIGCLRWKCWKKVWGKCIKRPRWKKCCKRITNPICKVRNFGCKALRKTIRFGLKVAEKLVRKSKFVLKAANVVLEGVKIILRKSKRLLDIANAFLEVVKRIYVAGTKALSAIARFTLGGIFDIREISFDVAVGKAATGHFRVSLLLEIFRRPKRFSLDLNFKNLLQFFRSLGQRIIRGLKKFIF